MRLIDADRLGIGMASRERFKFPEYADGWNAVIEIIEKAPTVNDTEIIAEIAERVEAYTSKVMINLDLKLGAGRTLSTKMSRLLLEKFSKQVIEIVRGGVSDERGTDWQPGCRTPAKKKVYGIDPPRTKSFKNGWNAAIDEMMGGSDG